MGSLTTDAASTSRCLSDTDRVYSRRPAPHSTTPWTDLSGASRSGERFGLDPHCRTSALPAYAASEVPDPRRVAKLDFDGLLQKRLSIAHE